MLVARDRVLTVRVPQGVLDRLDELAAHRRQARSALLRDALEAMLAGGEVAGADLRDPDPGEGLRLVAALARGGDAACARHLASLQERARLAAGKREDPLEDIWGAS